MNEATISNDTYTCDDGTTLERVDYRNVNGRPCYTTGRGEFPIHATGDKLYVHSDYDLFGLDCWVETLPAPRSANTVEVLPPPAAKPANPKQQYGDKKRPVQVVPPALMLGASKAFGEGASKYGAFNWRESAVEAMTYIGAIQRHLAAYIDGEDVDPESTTGKLHLEGIAACVGILLDCTYGGFLIDNRPPKGPAPELTRLPK